MAQEEVIAKMLCCELRVIDLRCWQEEFIEGHWIHKHRMDSTYAKCR